MSLSSKKCCVPSCMDSGGMQKPLHLFPNPEKDKQRFNIWVNSIGGDIIGMNNYDIYKHRRVCHAHFELKFCYRYQKLCGIAVPTLNLPGPTSLPTFTFNERRPLHQMHHDMSQKMPLTSTGNLKLTRKWKCEDHTYCKEHSVGDQSKTLHNNSHEISETGDSQDVNLACGNTDSPEIDNCESLKALPQTVDNCDLIKDSSQNNENLSIEIKERDVTQQTLPQDSPGCAINNESKNKEITTKEVPNKMYKVVSINDQINLVEQNENDLELDSANDHVDSPLDGYFEGNIFDCKNPDEGAKQPINISAIDEYLSKRYPTEELVDKGATVTDTSRIEGANSQAIPAKLNRIVKDFMFNLPDIVNHKFYKHQDILLYGRDGTALVLLNENKYKDIKAKLEEFMKIKNENAVYKKEARRLRVIINKLKLHVEELKYIKKCLHDSYSEAQIQVITKQKKPNISWTNEDIKNTIYLYQIINQAAYKYLKYHMKFPLPSLETVKMWMIERNIDFKTRKYKKVKCVTVKNESNIQNIDAKKKNLGIHEPSAEIQCYIKKIYSLQNQDEHESTHEISIQPCTTVSNNQSSQISEASETEQAFEMIRSHQQNITDDRVGRQNFEETVKKENGINNVSEEYYITHENCISNNDNDPHCVDGICSQDLTNVYKNEVEVYEDSAHFNISEDYVQDNEMNGDGDNVQSVDVNDAPSSNNAHDNTNEGNACGITSECSKWDLNAIHAVRKLEPNIKRNSWTCQLCKKPFDTEGGLKQHVPAHYHNTMYTTYLDAKTPFVCEFCNEQVPKRHSLVRHHVEHLGIEQFKCWHAGCTYVGRNKVCLKTHKKRHRPRRHSCPYPLCSATFTVHSELRGHFARKHSARGIYRCELCRAVSLSEYTFHQHILSHNKPPRYKCPEEGCPESFYSKRSLGSHKLSHSNVVYQCPHCPPATFTKAFQLERHLKRHKQHRIFKCNRCQQIFDSYGEYYIHMKTDSHTGLVHSCVCTQKFTSKLKLRRHQKDCNLVLKKKRKSKIYDSMNNENVSSQSNLPSENTEKELVEETIEEKIVDMDKTFI